MEELLLSVVDVHGVNDVRQTEIHAAEPLVPEPSPIKVRTATERVKSHKSPRTDQTPAELTEVRGNTLCSEIHRPIKSTLNEEELILQ
jgi:hypothetical protein